METKSIKEILIDEFQEDQLYKQIYLNNLEDELFTESILGLHKEGDYSTVDAARILNRPDSTIRNHFRSDLYNYIAPEKLGKYYRLNYQSIFRLHMIFLLMEKVNKTTVDLLAYLGMYASQTVSDNRVTTKSPKISNEVGMATNPELLVRIVKQEGSLRIQSILLKILGYENELKEIERKIDNKKSECDKAIADIKNQLLEEKQSAFMDNYLKEMSTKVRSFKDLFKKKEDTTPELKNKINGLKEKYDNIIKEISDKYQKEINLLEEDKQKVLVKINTEKHIKEVEDQKSLNDLIQETQKQIATAADRESSNTIFDAKSDFEIIDE